MKHELRKNETRKTLLFTLFTVMVIYMLSLDSSIAAQGATAAAGFMVVDR